jgi:hypothetical protein
LKKRKEKKGGGQDGKDGKDEMALFHIGKKKVK